MRAIFGLAMLVSCLLTSAANAADAKATTGASSGKPDWYGVWESRGSLNWDPGVPQTQPDRPPLTPEYQARYRKVLNMAAAGKPVDDPLARCLPLGFPRMMTMAYPFEILPGPDKITLIAEETSLPRRIWMDGRQFPEAADLEQSYNGYSIGRWEDNDLMVETRGLRGDMLLSHRGLEHTRNLRVTERWRQVDANTLKVDITLIDPIQFTRPWTVTKTYKRAPHLYIMEYVCEENNRNRVGPNGVTGVTLKSSQ